MPVTGSLLQTVPIFSRLRAEEIEQVAAEAILRQYAAGQVIAWADDPCQELYVLQKGTVRIFRLSEDGREQVLQVTKPGDVFAGAPVFCGCSLPSTCQAQDDVHLIIIPASTLLQIVASHPYIAMRVLGLCCARLRRLTSLAAELASRKVVRRLAWLLLEASAEQDTAVTCRLTEEQIAARLGTTQETISRALGQLRRRGIVEARRQSIDVLDIAALRRVATGLEPDL